MRSELVGELTSAVTSIGDLNVSADQHLEKLRPDILDLHPREPSIVTVHPNPISVDCRRSLPPFGARLVALSSSSLGLSIVTSLEAGVSGIEEREVVAVVE
ncbi:tetratricopeptide repeat protein 7A-like [Dorcoceras hygrometricum]|uniref:Tetratricopeptide repeat protein 7A-like n=1 Tax=Dorcoceras hygrometricum TaxID=472368 RepID=A0A2Z7BB02_9LAMI|nr:tetratricopeptide repeat protein 7A-like [Dorcoceras hygrometricum]